MTLDQSALGEGFYWMAEKLTWGYEGVTPDHSEALRLFKQAADLASFSRHPALGSSRPRPDHGIFRPVRGHVCPNRQRHKAVHGTKRRCHGWTLPVWPSFGGLAQARFIAPSIAAGLSRL